MITPQKSTDGDVISTEDCQTGVCTARINYQSTITMLFEVIYKCHEHLHKALKWLKIKSHKITVQKKRSSLCLMLCQLILQLSEKSQYMNKVVFKQTLMQQQNKNGTVYMNRHKLGSLLGKNRPTSLDFSKALSLHKCIQRKQKHAKYNSTFNTIHYFYKQSFLFSIRINIQVGEIFDITNCIIYFLLYLQL